MLIRSQNKLELVPLNKHLRVRIDETLSLFQIGYWDKWQGNDDYFNILGNYSTKEKALKVLDFIQCYYREIEITKISGFNCHETVWTFQMPQDDEVQ